MSEKDLMDRRVLARPKFSSRPLSSDLKGDQWQRFPKASTNNAGYFPSSKQNEQRGRPVASVREKNNSKREFSSKDHVPVAEYGSVQRPEWSRKSSQLSPKKFDFHGSLRDRSFSHQHQGFHNKEQYVHAICQFVMLDEGDYSANICDPDLPYDWDKIQELRLFVEELPTCPICLYEPVAAQMTRCGHVFCWPCILHYLALSDKPWRKCPICYESVYKNQLRSVSIICQKPFTVGDSITFVLMKRLQTSNVGLPATVWSAASDDTLCKASDELAVWFKGVVMSPSEVRDTICDRELNQLQAKLTELLDEPERCFVEHALTALEERMALLNQSSNQSAETEDVQGATGGRKASVEAATVTPSHCGPITVYADAFNDIVSTDEDVPHHEEVADVGMPAEVDGDFNHLDDYEKDCGAGIFHEASADQFCYFYQAEDCQHVFLHPVNIRCLVAEYGSLRNAPSKICGKVVEMENWTMDLDTRKRLRPLAHLSLVSEFSLAEIRFDRGILSRSTLDSFSEELQRRREARVRREKQEKRQERRAEKWHQSVMIQQRGYSCGTSLPEHGNPEIPVVTVVGSAQRDIERGLSATDEPISASPNDEQTVLSFAQMLRLGRRRVSRDLPSAMPDPRVTEGTGAWGQSPPGEDEFHAPKFQDSFGDALAKALDTIEEQKVEENEVESPRKGKRGKRQRGKVIFSI